MDTGAERRGRYIPIAQGVSAFIPPRLPPRIDYTLEPLPALSEADAALGAASSITRFLPNPYLLIVPFMVVEATMSSRIEGTYATLDEVMRARVQPEGGTSANTQEVLNYLDAMNLGIKRMPELSLSRRLVNELHAKLLTGTRGGDKGPGQFRREQVHVGVAGASPAGASYTPPPPQYLSELMDDWEKFLHAAPVMPPLVECAVAHAQFEMIHPYRDGNGRIGRVIMSLFLIYRGRLSQPVLLLSPYLEHHRDEYIARLLAISTDGDWQGWIVFLLNAIAVQSRRAEVVAQGLVDLRERVRQELPRRKHSTNPLALLDQLFQYPYITIPMAADALKVTYPTAQAAVKTLVSIGFLQEVLSGRPKQYMAAEIMSVIDEATSDDRLAPTSGPTEGRAQ